MPVEVGWYDGAQRILHYRLAGEGTWQEFYDADEKANALAIATGRRVDSIIDLTVSAGLPPDALQNVKQPMTTAPENFNLAVIIGANAFAQGMVQTFGRLYRRLGEQVQVADWPDKAAALILADRAQSQPQ